MKSHLKHRLVHLCGLALLCVTGCRLQHSTPVPTPTPTKTVVPTPSFHAARRLLPPDIAASGRAFIGPIPFASTVQTRNGASFVEARALAGQLDELTPEPRDFPVAWDFAQRTITIQGHTFKSGALVNRTGFVACGEAARAFDLKLEQHGDLTLFDPEATLGGTTNADHVYKDPRELWDHQNARLGPLN